MTKLGLSLAERFWPKVKKCKSGCWEWTAGIKSDGYGSMYVRSNEHPNHSNTHGAHQVSWFLHTGKWPTKSILHTCDNPPCIRFEHLYEGTQLDNIRDRDMREQTRKGDRHVEAILTAAKVRVIRLSHLPDVVWAKKFNVSREAVGMARRGISWNHIKNPPPRRRYKK